DRERFPRTGRRARRIQRHVARLKLCAQKVTVIRLQIDGVIASLDHQPSFPRPDGDPVRVHFPTAASFGRQIAAVDRLERHWPGAPNSAPRHAPEGLPVTDLASHPRWARLRWIDAVLKTRA